MSSANSVSLGALRRVKSDIESISIEAAHIAVYRFDTAITKWDRLGVEGAGFVVKTSSSPKWMLIVLNRAGPDNFTLDVATVLKIKLQPPYLMLRCATGGAPTIYGLWFHENDIRDKFATELQICQSTLANATRVPIIKHTPEEPSTIKETPKGEAPKGEAPKSEMPKAPTPATPEVKKQTPVKKATPSAEPEAVAQLKPSPAPANEPSSQGQRQAESAPPSAHKAAPQASPLVGITRSNEAATNSSVQSLPDLTKLPLSPSDITGHRRVIRKII